MEPQVIAHASAPAPSGPPPGTVLSFPMAARPDQTSLAAVFEAEESGLLRFAIGLVRRRDVAEELVQETFLRLHQVWGQVEQPRAWLYRSLRNLALNHLRDRPNEAELQEDAVPHDTTLPVDQLAHNEALGHVRLLLAELPPEDRDLIRLKYHENLKYHEIGRRTGLTSGNVGYRLHHLLKSLADRLRTAGVESSQG